MKTKTMVSYAMLIFDTIFVSAYHVGKEVAIKENRMNRSKN